MFTMEIDVDLCYVAHSTLTHFSLTRQKMALRDNEN